jgi:pimeloyl-ACP methyl ester carboxylesterase
MADWQQVVGDTRMECTFVTVPMDYAEPDGRQVRIAVGRLKASSAKPRGVLFVNPGGPGPSSISYPLDIADSTFGDLARDFDLIGFDTRGAGFSDRVDCDGDPSAPPVATTGTEKEKVRSRFQYEGSWNTYCGGVDRAFAAQLTTANVARDMNAIRAALGVEKINFYGASWGTGIGANYRSRFDSHTERMWLESVMPPSMDLARMDAAVDAVVEKNFVPFTEWLARHDAEYHLGTTGAAVRKTLLALRDELAVNPRGTVSGGEVSYLLTPPESEYVWAATDLVTLYEGGTPPGTTPAARRSVFAGGTGFSFNLVQNRAVICNDATGGRDFDTVWADKRAQRDRYPAAGGMSYLAEQCPQWPVTAKPWQLNRGRSALQLSGHLHETVTPYVWAKEMQAQIGGRLLTVLDDEHGSIRRTECGAKVVDFFRTGEPATGTCGGGV